MEIQLVSYIYFLNERDGPSTGYDFPPELLPYGYIDWIKSKKALGVQMAL